MLSRLSSRGYVFRGVNCCVQGLALIELQLRGQSRLARITNEKGFTHICAAWNRSMEAMGSHLKRLVREGREAGSPYVNHIVLILDHAFDE